MRTICGKLVYTSTNTRELSRGDQIHILKNGNGIIKVTIWKHFGKYDGKITLKVPKNQGPILIWSGDLRP